MVSGAESSGRVKLLSLFCSCPLSLKEGQRSAVFTVTVSNAAGYPKPSTNTPPPPTPLRKTEGQRGRKERQKDNKLKQKQVGQHVSENSNSEYHHINTFVFLIHINPIHIIIKTEKKWQKG